MARWSSRAADVEGRAEHARPVGQEEERRPDDPACHSVSVIVVDRGKVGVGGAVDPEAGAHLGRHRGVGGISPLVEQQGAQGQRHRFADGDVLSIGDVGQRKRRQRGGRKGGRVEPSEQGGGNLAAQVGHLVGDGIGVHRGAVDDLQRPGSHSEHDVVTSELLAALCPALQADMGEGAHDVGEDFDLGGGALHGCGPPWPRRSQPSLTGWIDPTSQHVRGGKIARRAADFLPAVRFGDHTF